MSFSVRTLEDGSYEIGFELEPAYCRPLPMSPGEIEPELLEGSWLVLLFAIWSVPDRKAIEEALSVARMYGGKVQLGVRPFDKHEEIRRWAKGVKEEWGSPVWLVLREGQILEEKVGLLKKEDLSNMVQHAISNSGT